MPCDNAPGVVLTLHLYIPERVAKVRVLWLRMLTTAVRSNAVESPYMQPQ